MSARSARLTGRLAETFARLRTNATGPGLVTYVTAGDPDLARTEGILRALERGGADVIEVGVPFSDPLADGPVIQRATERALAVGYHAGRRPRHDRPLTSRRPGADSVVQLRETDSARLRNALPTGRGKAAVHGVLVLYLADRGSRLRVPCTLLGASSGDLEHSFCSARRRPTRGCRLGGVPRQRVLPHAISRPRVTGSS